MYISYYNDVIILEAENQAERIQLSYISECMEKEGVQYHNRVEFQAPRLIIDMEKNNDSAL